MCGSCNQTQVMSDEATKVSPATQKQQAALSAGVGLALLVGLGAGAAIIMNRKAGHKTSSKRTRKGGSMSDAKIRMHTGKTSRQPKYVLGPEWKHIDYDGEGESRLTLNEIMSYFEAGNLKIKKENEKPTNLEDMPASLDAVIYPYVPNYWWGRIDIAIRNRYDEDEWKVSKLAEYSEPSAGRKTGKRK